MWNTFIIMEVGFVFGILMVWIILFFARAWRAAFFRMVDRFFDTMCILTMANVNSIRRRGNEPVLKSKSSAALKSKSSAAPFFPAASSFVPPAIDFFAVGASPSSFFKKF
ncbi:hypothetical protein EJB05_40098, partial [Eragrostis curvula]